MQEKCPVMQTCPLGVSIVDDELTWEHVRQTVLNTEGFQACQESEGSASQKQPTSKPSTPITRYISL